MEGKSEDDNCNTIYMEDTKMNKSRLWVSVTIFLAVFFLTALAICFTSFATDVNTVALWHFNEGSGQVAHDASGNGHDGTLGATDGKDNDDPEWIADGYAGSALEFDGGQCVTVPNDGSFDLSEGTIELWFKLKEPIEGNQEPWIMPIGKVLDGDFNFYFGFGSNPPGKLRFKMEKGGDDVSISSDSDQWNADQWYFVAGTFGPDGLKLYIDGVLQQQTSDSKNSLADINNVDFLGIGCDMWPGDPDYFLGVVDEVRISNAARGPDELGDYTTAPVEPIDKATTTWASIKAKS